MSPIGEKARGQVLSVSFDALAPVGRPVNVLTPVSSDNL
jgi:hypothetical protein